MRPSATTPPYGSWVHRSCGSGGDDVAVTVEDQRSSAAAPLPHADDVGPVVVIEAGPPAGMLESARHRPGLEDVDVEADVAQLRLDEALDGAFITARWVGLRRDADEVGSERDELVAPPVDLIRDPVDDRWVHRRVSPRRRPTAPGADPRRTPLANPRRGCRSWSPPGGRPPSRALPCRGPRRRP